MADDKDHANDDWANVVAKWTFWLTVILAALYVAAVVFYVLQ